MLRASRHGSAPLQHLPPGSHRQRQVAARPWAKVSRHILQELGVGTDLGQDIHVAVVGRQPHPGRGEIQGIHKRPHPLPHVLHARATHVQRVVQHEGHVHRLLQAAAIRLQRQRYSGLRPQDYPLRNHAMRHRHRARGLSCPHAPEVGRTEDRAQSQHSHQERQPRCSPEQGGRIQALHQMVTVTATSIAGRRKWPQGPTRGCRTQRPTGSYRRKGRRRARARLLPNPCP